MDAVDGQYRAKTSLIATDQQLFAGCAVLRYSLISPQTTLLRSIRAVTSTTRQGLCAGFLLQALVRTVAVIVLGVLGQDLAEMPPAEDQHVV